MSVISPSLGADPTRADPVLCLTESMQLAYLGLTVVLGRLTLELFDPEDQSDAREVKVAIESSLDIVESVVRFVEDLNPIDISDAFWFSFTPYHLSNTFSLLIRSLLAAKRVSTYSPGSPCALLDRSIALLRRYLSVLISLQHAPSSWEVTERALAKALTLCPSVAQLVGSEVGTLWRELGGLIWEGMRKSATAEVMLATVPGGPEVMAKTNGGGGQAAPGTGAGKAGGQQANGGQTMPSQPSPAPHPLSVYLAPSPQPSQHLQTFPPRSQQLSSSQSTTSNSYSSPATFNGNSHLNSNTLYNSQRPPFLSHQQQQQQHHHPHIPHLPNPPAYPPYAHPNSNQQLFQSHQLPPQHDPMGAGLGGTGGMDFSFETVVGEEDLWASVGDTQGFGWMGLGFEGGGGGGGGGARF